MNSTDKAKASPGYRRKVVDAPLSVSDTWSVPRVQEPLEKPERPLYVDPERSQYDDDDRYERRKHSAWKAYIQITMPAYEKRLADWEDAQSY